MKKTVKLTERDLTRIVKRVIKEQSSDEMELYTKMAQDHFKNMSKRKNGDDLEDDLEDEMDSVLSELDGMYYELKRVHNKLESLSDSDLSDEQLNIINDRLYIVTSILDIWS